MQGMLATGRIVVCTEQLFLPSYISHLTVSSFLPQPSPFHLNCITPDLRQSLSRSSSPFQPTVCKSVRARHPSSRSPSRETSPAMTDLMPSPQSTSGLPRNDSFSTEDIARAFRASALKPRNDRSLRIMREEEIDVPPPTPHEYISLCNGSERKRNQK